mgnify:CR=1 FL=1
MKASYSLGNICTQLWAMVPEAGMPKSVKHRKKDWMKAPAKSPAGTEDGDPEGGQVPSPMALETTRVFLSTYPMVLWISRKATGTV